MKRRHVCCDQSFDTNRAEMIVRRGAASDWREVG